MPLYLERLVRAQLGDGRATTHNRVIVPLIDGSFDGVPLGEALRRCREDARHNPENRAWVLHIEARPR